MLVVAERAESKADDAQTTADRAEGKADDALIGLESKQEISSAYKIGQVSVTEENVTITSLATHTFRVAIPEGQTDIVVLNARSSDTTRTMMPVNLYTSGSDMVAVMSNQRASAFTDETMTIQFTYAYK